MVQIKVRYDGDLRCSAQHGPSSSELTTDAPVDNQGKGAAFSPTDLVATALGTCMLTTMGIAARKQGLQLDGLELSIEKIMTKQPPRRIERLPVHIHVPAAVAAGLDEASKRDLESVARNCPVALSLRESIAVELQFGW